MKPANVWRKVTGVKIAPTRTILFLASAFTLFLCGGNRDAVAQQESQGATGKVGKPGPEAQERIVRTTICQVVSNPSSFNSRMIELRANVLAGLETNVLYDKSCGPKGQLPARILFVESDDIKGVKKTSDYQKFWSLVHARKDSKGKRRSLAPDKYTVTATFIGQFNTVGTTGQFITSRGILAVRSVRDVVAHPFDGNFVTSPDAKSPAKQTARP